MDNLTPFPLPCTCGYNATIYRGLWTTTEDEIVATWRCVKCKASCVAVIAGFTPKSNLLTHEDVEFLHKLGVSV